MLVKQLQLHFENMNTLKEMCEKEEAPWCCNRKWGVIIIGYFPTFINAALSVCAADRLILSSWWNKDRENTQDIKFSLEHN